MRTIKAATPYMSGTDVKALQQLLAENPFGDFAPGPIDGQAGPKTLDAIRRAKWRLGYPSLLVNRKAGGTLVAFLAGKKKLGPLYARTRAVRLAPAPKPLHDRIYEAAVSQLGQHEGVYNVCKFTKWWFGGLTIPIGWCSIFGSWSGLQAKSKAFRPCTVIAGRVLREGFSDFSDEILAAARSHKYGLVEISQPIRGCFCIWQWDTGSTDHTSVFEKMEGGMVVSIDGNVPDLVKRCVRSRSRVAAFVLATE